MANNERPLEGLVDSIMKAYRLDGKMEEMNIVNNWEELMGKAVSNRTKRVLIRNKTLILELDSSVMREELQSSKTILIQKVNEFAKKEVITDVWFS
jgi:predicted nucleic acid-binding Zn ribbon protein